MCSRLWMRYQWSLKIRHLCLLYKRNYLEWWVQKHKCPREISMKCYWSRHLGCTTRAMNEAWNAICTSKLRHKMPNDAWSRAWNCWMKSSCTRDERGMKLLRYWAKNELIKIPETWMSLEEWNILLENKAWNEIKCLLYKQ